MRFATFLTLFAAAAITAGTGRAAEAKLPAHPNVLFIAIDDLRDWVGYLGKNTQVKTPNLDRLAKRGVYFTHSYCAAPVCNASRTALCSGLRPATTGVYENNVDWRRVIPDSAPMLPQWFKSHGYYCAGAGKIYHEAYRRESDWSEYLTKGAVDPGDLEDGPRAQKKKAGRKGSEDGGVGGIKFQPLDCNDKDMEDYDSVSYCLKHLNRPHDKPLFLACGLHKPHMPWNVPRKYYDMYPLDKIELPKVLPNDLDDIPPSGVRMAKPEGDHAAIVKSGRWKDAVQGYLATITFCDAMVGRLIDGFDKSRYKDNTFIVVWSDHGWHLGEKEHWRKFALWEEATRSPLIWIVPGVTKPGAACDRTVDFMHVYPTLCDLCDLPKPGHVQGESIRKLLEKPDAPWDTPALTTYKYKNHAVRSEQWRYIRYENGDEELYNNAQDPLEWTNLAMKPEYRSRKAELARWLPASDAPWPEQGMKVKGKGKGKKNK